MAKMWIGVVSGAADPDNVFCSIFSMDDPIGTESSRAAVRIGTLEQILIIDRGKNPTNTLLFQWLKGELPRRYIWRDPDFVGEVPSNGTCAEIRDKYNVFIYVATAREPVATAVATKLKACGL